MYVICNQSKAFGRGGRGEFGGGSGVGVKGFALIATLSMLVLLALIAVGILSISSITVRSASQGLAVDEARANARMALVLAIGELQKTAGPDQVATASSSFLDSDPATLDVDGVAHPYWLGAYPTINPGSVNFNLLNPRSFRDWSLREVKWLVSNSETTGQPDPTAALSGDAVTMWQFAVDSDTVIPTGGAGVNGLSADLLGKAEAGLVAVEGGSGRYAWLVSDESMKARVDTLASTDGSDVLDGVLVDLAAQEQSNYETIQGTDFSHQLPTYKEVPEALSKLTSYSGLELIGANATDSSWQSWSKLNQDKFTVFSNSLPVDVMNGMLKKDLTAYLEGSYTRLDGESMIDARFSIDPEVFSDSNVVVEEEVTIDRESVTPSFSRLKQWAAMVDDHTVAQAVVAPDFSISNPQHGLYPIVTQGSVSMKLSYKKLTDRTLNPVYIFQPQIQIWNPHNVSLTAQDYIVQIGYQFKWEMQTDGNQNTDEVDYTGGVKPAFRSWLLLNSQEPLPVHKLASNEDIVYQGNKRFFTFVIKGQAFEPGESLLFHAKPPTSGVVSGVPYNLNGDADTDILNNYTADEDLNLLFNDGSIDEFFYVVSPLEGVVPQIESADDPSILVDNPDVNLDEKLWVESDFQSRTAGAGTTSGEDLDMHLNLYVVQDNQPALLHALKKAQLNNRFNTFKRPAYPLNRYQSGEVFTTDTDKEFGTKNPLINFGSSMLASNFDIFKGGDNGANTPPGAGQPHSVLGYWNVRHQESFSAPDEWSSSVEATSWLNSFSFRGIEEFFATWESVDNLYGNLSTDRLGGWHQSQVQGMTYPFFDYPTGDYGPLSMGSFQHANLSVHSWQPTYVFGNAQAPPRIDRGNTHIERNDPQDDAHIDLYDISYLLNASTWDSYYLSTIPQSGVSLEAGMRLPNSRLYLTAINGESSLDSAELTDDDGFDLSASRILIEGGFNVNSTSLTAWRAFLSGAIGQSVDTLHSTVPSNEETVAPMGRFFAPLLEESEDVAKDRKDTKFELANSWAATRTLNVDEIDALSRRIVEEVKRRGPFLSLADFVNRRLDPDASVTGDERVYQEVLGTLQAAINKTTVEDQLVNYHYYDKETTSGTKMTIKPDVDWEIEDVDGDPTTFVVSEEAQEAMLGLPKSKIDSDGGLIHSYAPNFLSQADVLTKIGPSITVRGDTFVIRAYGDSVNSAGDIKAKAWCEAVVQRTAVPVGWDGVDNAKLIQTHAPSDSSGLGRRFEVVSFRWLSEDEVTPYSDDAAITN